MEITKEQYEAINRLFKDIVFHNGSFYMCNICGHKGNESLLTEWETHDIECSFMDAKMLLEKNRDLYDLWDELIEEEEAETE